MPKETSAGAIIFRKENNEIYYLLLHYKSGPARNASATTSQMLAGAGGHWDFPKGHIEEGEKEEDTVKREVVEETGIKDIKIIEGFKEWIKYFFRQYKSFETRSRANSPRAGLGKTPWVFKTVTFYLAQTQTKEVKISFEHKGFKWLRYEEALKQLTFKNAKEILKKANEFLVIKHAEITSRFRK